MGIINNDYLRETFVDAMDAKLARNKHKVGTPRGKLPISILIKLLRLEVKELEIAQEISAEDMMDECVDVANFAMLIHKRLTVLGEKIAALEEANGGSNGC